MSNTRTGGSIEGIAIIGMSGRFPGAKNLNEFWRNLRDGAESVSFFSDEELRSSGVDPSLLGNPSYVKAKAILEDVELFDASFFGFSPREAEMMDPQHRLFLECAWETLESAGYDADRYEGLIGVFAGTSMNTYLLNNLLSNQSLIEAVGGYQTMLGNDKDFMATRVSYKLNLKGPSVMVQTACSTSLVAVQLACQSLLNYQCDMALAGGASVSVPHKAGYLHQEGMILSPDGHCRAFDAKAQGTIRGEGIGIIVLKRLADAIADGDCVHAVIKGSSINNDGSLKVGYTAPSVGGQAEVIAMAQAMAGVGAEEVTYIEAHGTGTPLGDPIEIAALTQVFRAGTERNGFCAIGSVKTNIGHLDAAAGVAGLIKTVLSLKHKLLPPSLHFQEANPQINFKDSPFYVNTRLSKWEAGEAPRRAGVSSFGIGGTNAHVFLEEAPVKETSGSSRPWQMLALSAKTGAALNAMTTNLAGHLKQNADNLADVAYTLLVGRRTFNHRRIVVCRDLEDAVTALETLDPKRVFTSGQESADRPVVFMFTGQGSQYVNMGLELYQAESTFREEVDRCSEHLKPHLGLDLREVLYPSKEKAEEAAEKLNQTFITQPALFVIEYALAKLWSGWGVHPQAMIGHSIGEYVAACLAGVFSLEDALALVAMRGQLMQKVPSGAMLAVPLSEKEMGLLLANGVSLAALNGPSLCVVSGPTDSVAALQRQLDEQGVNCRRLHTSHAFHSQMMEPVLKPFTEEVRKVKLNPPQIPYVSNLTGAWITGSEATDPNYWARHLRQTVRFSEGVSELLKEADRGFLEVGPGETLSSIAKRHGDLSRGKVILSSLRRPQEQQSDAAFLLTTIGRLWLAGVRIDWDAFYAGERRSRLPLPTYPFERRRYWIEPRKGAYGSGIAQGTLSKRPDVGDWFYIPSWKRSISPKHLNRHTFAGEKSCWLVFVDECGLGRQLAKRLEQEEQVVVEVKIGEKFTKVREALYAVNPRSRSDYDALIKELCGLDRAPTRIAHLWCVTRDDRGPSDADFLEQSQELGFYSLLFLAQALGEQQTADPVQLDVLSNHMQEVNGEELIQPEKATVLGPCRVIPQEYTNITCRSIDIAFSQSPHEDGDILIDHLMAELTSKASEAVIAYRGRHRWVQSFELMRLDSQEGPPIELRQGSVYLITGGLGGIGLVLARYLAEAVRAKLVLTGRNGLPPREQWSEWLETHDAQDGICRKIRKVQELEGLGAEVLTMQADVSDLAQMRQVITRATERFGGIHGAIHAAGVAGGGAIPLKTVEMAVGVLAPKVQGTVVLSTLLRDVKPDFLLLCSSITSLLPPPGQIDYCAANAFLDAFAQCHHSDKGTRVVSVNWDTWQEVGMAADTPVPLTLKKAREEVLKKGISSKEGVDAFRRILSSSLPQVIVSTKDLQAMFARFIKVESLSDTKQADKAGSEESSSLYSRLNLSSSYVAPETELQQAIADIWQELLGIDRVGIYDNFFDIGGHSLLATQVIARIEKKLGLRINQAELTFQSLGQLASACEERMRLSRPSEPRNLIQKLSHTIKSVVSHRTGDRN